MTIAKLGEGAFTSKEELQAFRRELARLRFAIASHMAAWPVVSINHDDPAYVASLATHREAYRLFMTWVRDALRSM